MDDDPLIRNNSVNFDLKKSIYLRKNLQVYNSAVKRVPCAAYLCYSALLI